MTEKIRLQRYLSSAGVAARRKAEELIVAGHVRVNGKQVRLLGSKVDPVRDHVTVNGEAIHPLDKFYVLFNKPKGCVTAVEDERGRATVMEYLPNLPVPVRPVGRLDYYAEGVVLLTNDGELAARLTSSQRSVPKTYHVKVSGEVTPKHVEALRAGVRLEDNSTTLPAEVNFLPGESRHSWLGITVVENKQHQVQRMLEALGFQVQKLQCVAFANLSFHGLRVGDGRELSQSELNALRDLVELDHSVTTRGIWRTYREDTDIPRRAREKLRLEAAEAEAEAGEPISDWRDADSDSYEFEARSSRGPREERSAARGTSREERGARSGPRDPRGPREERSAARGTSRDARGAARDDRNRPGAPREERGGRPGRPARGESSFGGRDDRPSRPGVRAGTSFGPRSDARSFGSRDDRPSRGGTSFGPREDRPGRGRPPARPAAARPAGAGQGNRPRFGQSEGERPSGRPSGRPSARPSTRPSAASAGRTTRRAAPQGARAERATGRPASRPSDRSVGRAVDRAVDRAGRPPERAAGRPTGRPPERAAGRPTDRRPAAPSARPARGGQSARPAASGRPASKAARPARPSASSGRPRRK